MKMYVCDSGFNRIADIGLPSSCDRTESINAENTLNFSLKMRNPAAAHITPDSVIEIDGDYFDIAAIQKQQGEDGQRRMTVECEHISYRLNNPEYNVEYFTMSGSPSSILSDILSGTGLTPWYVQFTEAVTISIQEAASRRGLLMQFVQLLGGELLFEGLNVSILRWRGSSTPKVIQSGKDIQIISERIDKRELTDSGEPTISYTCGVLNPGRLELGDDIQLDYPSMSISAELRVISKSFDPFNPKDGAILLGNRANMLESDIYSIKTDTVIKDKAYNGVRIGPESGLEAVDSDNKARVKLDGDTIAFQVGDGSGDNWKNVLYSATNPETDTAEIVFDGRLGDNVKIILQFDHLPTQGEIDAMPDNVNIVVYDTQNPYVPV